MQSKVTHIYQVKPQSEIKLWQVREEIIYQKSENADAQALKE